MSEVLRPLAMYGTGRDGDHQLLVSAKAAMNMTYKITPIIAVPGGPTRVLALREIPNFLCDYALVTNPENPASLLAAMTWVLEGTEDSRATSLLEMLQAIFGPNVKEIPYVPEPIDPELDGYAPGVRFEQLGY